MNTATYPTYTAIPRKGFACDAIVLVLVLALHGALFAVLWWAPREPVVLAEQPVLKAALIVRETPQDVSPQEQPPNTLPAKPKPVVTNVPMPKVLAALPTEATVEPETLPEPVSEPLHESVEPTPVALAPAEPAPVAVAPSPVIPPRFDAQYLDNPAPSYPSLSRRLREQGTVMLRVYVQPTGLPADIELKQSSGHARLDEVALDTVKRWRFVPARQNDTAVAGWVVVPITFSLRS